MAQFASTLHPQTNPTNPILLDFRDMGGTPIDADLYLSEIFGRDGDLFLSGVPHKYGHITQEQIVHAIRVLTRLASFSG